MFLIQKFIYALKRLKNMYYAVRNFNFEFYDYYKNQCFRKFMDIPDNCYVGIHGKLRKFYTHVNRIHIHMVLC